MRSGKLIFFTVLLFFLAGLLFANTPPSVTNVSASQRTDGSKIVDIWYSVNDADNDTLTVSLAVTNDNGASFGITPSPANLSGAIGENILSGSNKHIVWNAGAEGITFAGSQFKVKVTATEKINLSNGLVAYYPFNGNANDESGNGHDGTLVGASICVDRFDVPDRCVFLNGTSWVQVPASPDLSPSTQTLCVWAKFFIGGTDNPRLISRETISWQNGYNSGYSLSTITTNPYRNAAHCISRGGINNSAQSDELIQANTWHFYTSRFDGQYLNLYIDGELVSSVIVSGSIDSCPLDLMLGRNSRSMNDFLYGCIDDVRIFNRAIADQEIMALYHENDWPNSSWSLIAYYPLDGNTTDESGNGHNGTIIGATSVTDRFGNESQAFNFNNIGTNKQYIDCGDLDLANISFSISAWGYNTGDCNTEYILGHGSPGVNYNNLHIGYWVNSCFSFIFFGDDLNGPYYESDPGWHHWVCTFNTNGRIKRIYRDGQLVAENTSSQNYQGIGKLVIGIYDLNNDGYVTGWNGKIDDLRIYARALSSSEIQALYHEGGWNGN